MKGDTPSPKVNKVKPMNVTEDTLKQLRQPLPERAISWRVGQTNSDKTFGQALPYIDNRIVQNRLDEVLGASNWTNRFVEVTANNRLLAVRCILGVRIDGQWVEKEDAAQLDDSAQGSRELAIKGVYSDAMKRAAVQWGVGRYLYDYVAPWVALDSSRHLTEIPRLPEHMRPEGDNSGPRPLSAPTVPAAAPAPVAAPAAAPAPVKAAAKPEADAFVEPVSVKTASAPVPVAQPSAVSAPVEESAQPAAMPAPEHTHEVSAEPQAQAAPVESAPVSESAPSGAMPEGLTAEQKALVDDLLAKIQKLPPKMIRAYITGPKGQEKLTAAARDFLLAKVAEKEALADAS